MKVRVIEPRGDYAALWNELAAASEHSCFWATPLWVNAIASAYGWKPVLFVADAGEHRLLLPSVRVKTVLTFGSYISFPLGYGSVLSDVELDEDLLTDFFSSLSGLTVTSVVANLPPSHPVPRAGDCMSVERGYTHILHLATSVDDVVSGFSAKCRWRVRRAERAGLVCERPDAARGLEFLRGIYDRWVEFKRPERRYPSKLFEAIASFPEDVVRVFVASAHGTHVAALLNFVWKDEVYNFIAVDVRTEQARGAVNLLHYCAIRDAVEAGAKSYIFGESLGIRSLEAFKESFGAQRADVFSVVVEGRAYANLKRLLGV